jgi:hypothetical protein
LIDDWVWWYIENDMYQYWLEIEVKDDVFLMGNKNERDDLNLSEVHTATTIMPDGRFQTVVIYEPPARIDPP